MTVTRDEVSGPPYDPVLTPTDYAAIAWRDTYSAEERAGTTILETDTKIYIVNSSPLTIAPAPPDTITIDGKTYSIVRTELDAAGAAYVCQCRI